MKNKTINFLKTKTKTNNKLTHLNRDLHGMAVIRINTPCLKKPVKIVFVRTSSNFYQLW